MSDSTPTLERMARALYEFSSPPSAGFKDWSKLRDDRRAHFYAKARAALDASGNDERLAALERVAAFAKHSGLCGIIGGYGRCTCGLQDAFDAAAIARTQEQSDG